MIDLLRSSGILLVAIAATLFASCTPDIVFVSDEYLHEIAVDEAFEQSVHSLARDRDQRIRLAVVGEPEDAVPTTEADCYLFAPLLRDVGLDYARGTEALVYLIGSVEDVLPANVATVTFERFDAFRRAGASAGELTTSSDSSEAAGTIGAMIRTDTEDRRREWEAFLEGFRETSGGAAIWSRLYSREPRREELRSDARDMITRGISTLVVSLGEQNAFVLDLLSGHDIRVITEDAAVSGGYADKIVLSIERPLLAAVASTLDSCVSRELEPIVVAAELRRLDGRNGEATE